MDKEMTDAMFKIDSHLEEQRILIEELRKYKAGEKPVPKTETKDDGELERLRKIVETVVGDFHPGPASKTYRELYDENQKLNQTLKEQSETIVSIKAENTSLKEQIEKQEKEILHLRNHPVQAMAPEPAKSETEKIGIFGRRKETVVEPEKKQRTEEEMRRDLQTLLFSPRFSDGQVELLAQILTNDKTLPTMALAQLVDPRLTTDRMLTLYRLLCAQHHVEPVIEMSVSDVEQENLEEVQEDETDSGKESFDGTSGQNRPEVFGSSTSGSGGQTKGSIPHKTIQQRKGR